MEREASNIDILSGEREAVGFPEGVTSELGFKVGIKRKRIEG